ncbi:DUF2721 domain-containing protein [Erythrobacter sp. YT30]|uniref:DUF2721 domain-containing protein n=1 Tax=Erythrobacter sp. YT30 TaxID=1735012 RepID=UPI00076C358C|nr:DUF2721 domain-containing protein [Erythrobacter sp. YT30]KWV92157.1 GTP-binding protein [Erythrobacter sp. YT30]
MIELFSAAGIATEIIERTSNTPDVQRAVQLSLAPAFLLVAIGSIMNVMVTRLNWIAGRIERLDEFQPKEDSSMKAAELAWLRARRSISRRAIKYSTGAACVISVVIALLFVSVYIDARIGTFVAVLWVVTMGLLIFALSQFLRETLLAAEGPRKG